MQLRAVVANGAVKIDLYQAQKTLLANAKELGQSIAAVNKAQGDALVAAVDAILVAEAQEEAAEEQPE